MFDPIKAIIIIGIPLSFQFLRLFNQPPRPESHNLILWGCREAADWNYASANGNVRCLFCNIFPDRVHVFELIPQQRQQPFLNLVSLLNCAAAAAKPVIYSLLLLAISGRGRLLGLWILQQTRRMLCGRTSRRRRMIKTSQPAQTIIIIRRCVAAITAKLLFRNFCQRSSEEKGMRVQRDEV